MAGIWATFEDIRGYKYNVDIDPERLYMINEVIEQDLLCMHSYAKIQFGAVRGTITAGKKIRVLVFTESELKELGLYDSIKEANDRRNGIFKSSKAGRFPINFIKGEDLLKYMCNNLNELTVARLRERKRFKDLFYVQTGAINF